MTSAAPGPLAYRLVLRGEVGDEFAVLFDGLRIERTSGRTIVSGEVRDQAHLAGILDRAMELGMEIVSLTEVGSSRDS